MSRSVRRIVLYAVNGAGLGHVTRLVAVARWLRRTVTLLEGKPPEVLFLTSSEATQVLSDAGFASFKLPSKTLVRATGMNMVSYRRHAKHFVWNTLGTMAPDLLVVDTFPSGSFDELFQLLDGPFAKSFVCREVKPEYARRPVYQAALSLYDAVVVPHEQGRARTPKHPHARFSGEVVQVESCDVLARGEASRLLGIDPDVRLVYLSAGGGGDPSSEATLHALHSAIGGRSDVHLLIGAGPLYRGARLNGPSVTWWTEPRVSRFFGRVDAAISAAGYNTFHELLHLGVPTVFYDQPKVADDQRGRVEQAVAQRACLRVADVSDPEAVRQALEAALADPELGSRARAFLPHSGAQRAAELLLGPCYSDAQLDRARALLTPAIVRCVEGLPDRGAAVLGRWLPELFPAATLGGAGAERTLQRLLERLPSDAAEAVREILDDEPSRSSLDAALHAVSRYVTGATESGVSLDAALSVLEVARKKHPLRQEPHNDAHRWVERLADSLTSLLWQPTRDSAPAVEESHRAWCALGAADRVDLYKRCPRVVDASLGPAVAGLSRWLGLRLLEVDSADASGRLGYVIAGLRDLKKRYPRLTGAALEALNASAVSASASGSHAVGASGVPAGSSHLAGPAGVGRLP